MSTSRGLLCAHCFGPRVVGWRLRGPLPQRLNCTVLKVSPSQMYWDVSTDRRCGARRRARLRPNRRVPRGQSERGRSHRRGCRPLRPPNSFEATVSIASIDFVVGHGPARRRCISTLRSASPSGKAGVTAAQVARNTHIFVHAAFRRHLRLRGNRSLTTGESDRFARQRLATASNYNNVTRKTHKTTRHSRSPVNWQ